MLRRLQAAPLFPYFVEYPDIVERLFAHVRRTGLFADGLLDPHFERLVRLTERYAQDRPPMVSSHNDLNLRNILFDGTRLWLIDWESAYRNDPLTDVAVLLDNLAASPDEEAALLAAWHGGAPDRAMRERLDVVRALTRLYYAGVLLSAAAALPHDAPDRDLAAPSTDDFIAMVRARSLTSHTPQTVHLLGKIYLASFLSGARVPPLDVL
jgi:Ser/Thr protein kinase RdoA (MazF antagonist)